MSNVRVATLSVAGRRFIESLPIQSPRSGRQHKAWALASGIAVKKSFESREAGGGRIIWTNVKSNGYRPLRRLD
jgi:hypothetical protein